MAKSIPNSRNVKQGHTLYWIDEGYEAIFKKRTVRSFFLHSRKKELPPEGCIIEEMPVNFMREILDGQYPPKVFFSKKKANSYIRNH